MSPDGPQCNTKQNRKSHLWNCTMVLKGVWNCRIVQGWMSIYKINSWTQIIVHVQKILEILCHKRQLGLYSSVGCFFFFLTPLCDLCISSYISKLLAWRNVRRCCFLFFLFVCFQGTLIFTLYIIGYPQAYPHLFSSSQC